MEPKFLSFSVSLTQITSLVAAVLGQAGEDGVLRDSDGQVGKAFGTGAQGAVVAIESLPLVEQLDVRGN